MKNENVIYRFQQQDNVHEIYIYDEIKKTGPFNWETWQYEDSETSAKHFKELLDAIPETDEIKIYFNSNGGSVDQGTAIYNMLKQHGSYKTGIVMGVCHSIAFTILQACDKRIMGQGTTAIIHDMWETVTGNAADLRAEADNLDVAMESCIALFMQRAADFQKTMQQVNTAVQENSNSFKLAKAAWDDSTTAVEKLKDRQEYLAKQTDVYSDKVEILKRELEEMKSAENRNEDAIRKKQNQLTSAQISLTKYQKGLAEVTEELESGAAESKEQIRKLSDKIAESTDKIKANEIEIEALKSKYDDHIKSIVKYKDEQKYLSNQTENYERILESLKKQLDILKSAENKDEKAIQDKKNEINETTTKLNGYKSKLEDVEQKLKSGAAVTEGYAEKVQAFGNKAKETGDKFSGISTAAAGIVAATAATVPATAEYRKIMGSLEVSSQNAGYTAEQTAESYRTLYGVLADDQTAATTTANLQALGLSQEELSTVIEGTIGAWATYGDSIPIDGLAESINETVKTSTVTGTFADMLNWAGTSEDAFNEKLAACGSESERVNLVMQEMANQGLVDAGKKWQENNKNLVDGNKATADFQQATAELADTVAPLITKITELVAGLIEEFNQLSPEGQRLIAGCVLVVAAVGPVFSIISKVAGGVSSLIGIISKIAPVLGPIKTGFAAVNAVMAANPILIIIAAVAALIAIFVTLYNKCEWFRDGVNAIFGAVADFIKGAIDKIKGFFDFDWKLPKIKLPHFKASGEWSLSPLKVPKISVDWYANGGILNSPTIFGANGDSLMGGGEAGKEAVLPIKLLKDYIREENDANNATLAAMIVEAFKSISMTAENNIYIGDKKSITLLTNLVLKQMANKTLATQGAKGK